MARHRLMPHAKEPALVCRSFTSLVIWLLNRPGLAAVRQRLMCVTWTSALSVAMIACLVLAGAVSAAARRFPGAAPALHGAAFTPVATVTPASTDPLGPLVIAVQHPKTGFHIAAAPTAMRARWVPCSSCRALGRAMPPTATATV